MTKSPFLLIENFISPLECENIIASITVADPNVDHERNPIKTILKLPVVENRIWARIENYFEDIEHYYDTEIDNVSTVDVEWYSEDCVEEKTRCENSFFIDNKWRIFNDYDFTVVVFLKDYNSSPDFDDLFECYGGKLEMVNHNFAFNPTRGMAIIFPSNQYFINKTTSPAYGDAFQLRFHMTCLDKFVYDRDQFKGNYTTWFKGLT